MDELVTVHTTAIPMASTDGVHEPVELCIRVHENARYVEAECLLARSRDTALIGDMQTRTRSGCAAPTSLRPIGCSRQTREAIHCRISYLLATSHPYLALTMDMVGGACHMRDEHAPDDDAQITLTPDEAVVLFELLWRWSDARSSAATPSASCFESTAECAVLHRVLAGLEKQMVAPFKEQYVELLGEARSRLQPSWGYPTLKG